MTSIPFNALDEQTRARFAAALTGAGDVRPIYYLPGKKGRSIGGWIFLALVASAIHLLLLSADYGHLSLARQSAFYLFVYFVLQFLTGWSILRVIHNIKHNRLTPYPSGMFLFATDLVLAEGPNLRIYPLAEMLEMRQVGQIQGIYDTDLVFEGFSQRLILGGPIGYQRLQEIQRAWEAARAGMVEGADLFAGVRGTQVWTDPAAQQAAATQAQGGTIYGSVAGLFKRPALIALAFLFFAPPIWLVRNYLSDESAYAEAQQLNEVWAVNAYIHGEGRNADEARRVFLPAAAFAKAQRTGEPVGLREFWTTYPQAPQVPEAKTMAYDISFGRATAANTSAAFAAFRTEFPEAPQAEPARIKQRDLAYTEAQGNVSKLRAFTRDFAQAPQVAQALLAINTRYRTVTTQFEEQAGRNRSMRQFMASLIEWLERNESSEVQVRFHAPSASQLAAVDTGIRVGGRVTTGFAPIAPHFTQERCVGREQAITNSLRSAFGAVFPPDIMTLHHMGRVAEGAPAANVPTIDVHYVISASGTLYHSRTDSRAYVGINVNFRIEMRVPGGEDHSTRVSVRPPRTFTVSNFGGFSSDSSIYSTMADRAFERLSDELRRHFFRRGSPAYNAARPRT